MSEIKQAVQNASLAEQQSLLGSLVEKESVWVLEARSGYTERLKSYCSLQ